ncbi:MAG: response regulator transcription factor [Spirochaetes bacterium]|nr:response regulator transcription factor [Spirochaetota bacterium]
MKAKVLIIEDEREIGELVTEYLVREGIEAVLSESGEEGLKRLEKEPFDLIVLDINLPGIDGFEFLSRVRKKHDLPVVIVSARNSDEDMVLGLGIGADDFVTKPFSPKVLVARVRANLRRFFDSKTGSKKLFRFGPYLLDLEGNILEKEGARISVPPKEFELLCCLVSNCGRAMTPETLYDRVWGRQYGDIATVAIHVQRLRRRIEEDPSDPRYIETIHGFGYRFNPDLLKEGQ